MIFNQDILIILLAGIVNGSFVIPVKYTKNLSNEKIWFYHSFIGLVILQWVLLYFTDSSAFSVYAFLTATQWLYIIIGGMIFGTGQVFFAYAIERLGVALSFATNISIGLIIGSMFVVFYQKMFFSVKGGIVTLAVLLIITAIVLNYLASRKHKDNAHNYVGWVLVTLTGLASGIQNATFFVLAFHESNVFQNIGSFWVWPVFLLAAAVPMIAGFSFRIKKAKITQEPALSCLQNFSKFIRNLGLILLMGLFFTGSLVLYSNGMDTLTGEDKLVGWPVLMICIILSSQIWGFLYGEAKNTILSYKFFSIFLLSVSVLLLAFK